MEKWSLSCPTIMEFLYLDRGKKESTGVFRQEMATWGVEICHIPATEGFKKTVSCFHKQKSRRIEDRHEKAGVTGRLMNT